MSDILHSTQVGSSYRPDPEKTYTHQLPAAGPRDLAKTAPSHMTIRDRIVETIGTIGQPCTVREVYEKADFKFPSRDMTSRLQGCVNAGRVIKEKIEGIYMYSLPQWDEQERRQLNTQPEPESEPEPQPDPGEKQDPLISVINNNPPGIANADMHAERLRALASWPAMHEDIALWLCGLANTIEGGAR